MKSHYALRQAKLEFLVANRNSLGFDKVEDVARAMQNVGLYSPATKTADIVPGLLKLLRNVKETAEHSATIRQNKTAQCGEPCAHHNWAVRQYDRLGFGRCLDCHKEIPLTELFELLKKRAAILQPHRAERANVAAPALECALRP